MIFDRSFSLDGKLIFFAFMKILFNVARGSSTREKFGNLRPSPFDWLRNFSFKWRPNFSCSSNTKISIFGPIWCLYGSFRVLTIVFGFGTITIRFALKLYLQMMFKLFLDEISRNFAISQLDNLKRLKILNTGSITDLVLFQSVKYIRL